MSLEQKQLPASSGTFTNDNRTDGDPDYTVTTRWGFWHEEPILVCLTPVYIQHLGNHSYRLPIWRMNGAGPNDSKIPVILGYGTFSNRYGVDYGIDGETYSLARFLANRGRDVWIFELENASEKSSLDYFDYLTSISAPWKTWYEELLTTDEVSAYTTYQAYFLAQDICSVQTPIVTADDKYTSTVDDYIFRDLPAIISTVLYYTGQTQAQWFGHSMGALIMFGFLPTELESVGQIQAGYVNGPGWLPLPAKSILSLTALATPTALINCPQYLLDLHNSGDLNRAWEKRGKMPRYYYYLSQRKPRWPVQLQGIMDTAFMKHLDLAITDKHFAFFNRYLDTQQYYHLLYEGQTLYYAWPGWNQRTIPGHAVTVPVTSMYDGNGYDDLATWNNVSFIPNKLAGYKTFKPFFQFIHDFTCHAEMMDGYNVENGDLLHQKDLNYIANGTYHYIWYDLNRYLPPAPFSAYVNDITCSGDPLISWQNLRDSVSFEIWARQGNDPFSKKVAGVNSVRSAADCAGLSSGVWTIKVRAVSLGGSWQDHSGASSIGAVDDPSLYLSVTKT